MAINRKKQFGERLRKIRQQKNLSQENLAFECGVQRTYISDIEQGHRSVGIEVIWKLAKGLDIHPAVFFLTEAEKLKYDL